MSRAFEEGEDAAQDRSQDGGSSFFGKYRGVVISNQDPLKIGRIKVMVPDVYGDHESDWALPCLPFTGDGAGCCLLPPKDAWVWIEFEQGDPDYPIWVGGFFKADKDVPEKALDAPYKKLLVKTPGGHQILIDDDADKGGVTLRTKDAAELVLNPDGVLLKTKDDDQLKMSSDGILLQTRDGDKLELTSKGITLATANGDKLELKSEGITLQTAGGQKVELASAGITLKTSGGQKLALLSSGVELSNGSAGVKLSGPMCSVNNGALEVS